MAVNIQSLPKTPWGMRYMVWQGNVHPFAGTHAIIKFTKPMRNRDVLLPLKSLPLFFNDWHTNKLRLDPAKPSQVCLDIKAGECTFSLLADLESFVRMGKDADEVYRNSLGFVSFCISADTTSSLEAIQGIPKSRIHPSIFQFQNQIDANIRTSLGHRPIYDWTQWLYVFAMYQIAKELNYLDIYKGIEGMVRMAEDSGASMLTYIHPIASHYGISGELGWFTINDAVSRIKALFEKIKESMPVEEFIRQARERKISLGSFYNFLLAYNAITGQTIKTEALQKAQIISADERPDKIPAATGPKIRTINDLPPQYLYWAGINHMDLRELKKAVIGKTQKEARGIVIDLIRKAKKRAEAKSKAATQTTGPIIIKTPGDLPSIYMYRAGIYHISLREIRKAVLGRTQEEAEGILIDLINKAKTVIPPKTQEISADEKPDKTQIDIDLIKKVTSEYYSIRFEDMTANTRSKEIATARQLAMYLARTMTPASLPKIGEEFGGRDHTTVMHACEKITEEFKTNPAIKEAVKSITDSIKKHIRLRKLKNAALDKNQEEARRILIGLINKAKTVIPPKTHEKAKASLKTASLMKQRQAKPAAMPSQTQKAPALTAGKPVEKPYTWEKEYPEVQELAIKYNKKLIFTLSEFANNIMKDRRPEDWPQDKKRIEKRFKRRRK
jgi:hypothetical protein